MGSGVTSCLSFLFGDLLHLLLGTPGRFATSALFLAALSVSWLYVALVHSRVLVTCFSTLPFLSSARVGGACCGGAATGGAAAVGAAVLSSAKVGGARDGVLSSDKVGGARDGGAPGVRGVAGLDVLESVKAAGANVHAEGFTVSSFAPAP